jgi:rRNA biogenesis protein RRP5
MAPIEKKRKNAPTNESFARSRKASDGDDRPSKRLRPDEKEGKPTTGKFAHAPKISKTRDEDVPFPRGGASVLTPLEHKQIQIDATRDVLFEQQSGKSANVDLDGQDHDAVQPTKKKAKSKSKGKKGQESSAPEEDVVKIEGLSYTVC